MTLNNISISHLNSKCICLHYSKTDGIVYIGTGILVKYNKNYFLVTAAHNINDVVFNSIVLYYSHGGAVKTLPIIHYVKKGRAFVTSNMYDLSVIKLKILHPNTKQLFESISVPFVNVLTNMSFLPKGKNVIASGFNEISQASSFSFLPNQKNIATEIRQELMNYSRADNGQKSKLFFIDFGAERGMSGGPVFTNHQDWQWGKKYKLIGVLHAIYSESDGRKVTSVTPLTDLKVLLKKAR